MSLDVLVVTVSVDTQSLHATLASSAAYRLSIGAKLFLLQNGVIPQNGKYYEKLL